MSVGLVGKKCGMTRVFTPEGNSIPVTVIEVGRNTVVQLKNEGTDGYRAVQVTSGLVKQNRVSQPLAGHYKKSNVEAGILLKEFRLSNDELPELKVGDDLSLDMFSEGQAVDIRGVSKGKGFAGVIKRHNFSMQDATHGNSLAHRAAGSIGQCQTPGRVFKGKKMAGQMGNVNTCAQNLKIVKIDQDKKVILVRGAVPGAPGGIVFIRSSLRNKGEK